MLRLIRSYYLATPAFGCLQPVAQETVVTFVLAAAIGGASYTIQRARAPR